MRNSVRVTRTPDERESEISSTRCARAIAQSREIKPSIASISKAGEIMASAHVATEKPAAEPREILPLMYFTAMRIRAASPMSPKKILRRCRRECGARPSRIVKINNPLTSVFHALYRVLYEMSRRFASDGVGGEIDRACRGSNHREKEIAISVIAIAQKRRRKAAHKYLQLKWGSGVNDRRYPAHSGTRGR